MDKCQNLILVQYYPLRRVVGRYARTTTDCINFNESFTEQVRASDWEHQSIILCFDIYNDVRMYTPNELRTKCMEVLEQKIR